MVQSRKTSAIFVITVILVLMSLLYVRNALTKTMLASLRPEADLDARQFNPDDTPEVPCGQTDDGHPQTCPAAPKTKVRGYHVIQSVPYQEDKFDGLDDDVSRTNGMSVTGLPATDDIKTLLVWTDTTPNYLSRCPQFEQRCRVTMDRDLVKTADAVIINTRNVPVLKDTENFPYHAHRKQILVFYNIEAAIRIKDLLKPYNDVFNLTMTYRLDSDIPVRHVTLWPRPASEPYVPPTAADMAGKTQSIMWIISHCDKAGSNRWAYVQELSKYIDVEIFGACGKSGCPPGGGGTDLCMTKAEQQYKFYLSLENSDCKDYVTEKLYKALARNVIPVVHGGLDYDHELPDKSVIRLIDFESPKHLADYLLFLSENDEEYLKYFEWKRFYQPSSIGTGKATALCHLCQILHEKKYPFRTNFDAHKWWTTQSFCTPVHIQARKLGLPVETSTNE